MIKLGLKPSLGPFEYSGGNITGPPGRGIFHPLGRDVMIRWVRKLIAGPGVEMGQVCREPVKSCE